MARLLMLALILTTGCTATGGGVAQLDPAEEREGWRLLFDGDDLDGWIPRGEAVWETEDGIITPRLNSGRGFLATADDYDDFRLRAEFWVDETANGGIFLRVPQSGDITQSNSFEVNIFDAHELWPTASINEIQRNDDPSTTNRWNTLDITADDDHLVVVLNGDTTVDARARRLPSGPIAIQYVGTGVIRYRNLRLLPL